MVLLQKLPHKFNISTTIRLFYYYNGHHTLIILIHIFIYIIYSHCRLMPITQYLPFGDFKTASTQWFAFKIIQILLRSGQIIMSGGLLSRLKQFTCYMLSHYSCQITNHYFTTTSSPSVGQQSRRNNLAQINFVEN
jgi:hypothetical protein